MFLKTPKALMLAAMGTALAAAPCRADLYNLYSDDSKNPTWMSTFFSSEISHYNPFTYNFGGSGYGSGKGGAYWNPKDSYGSLKGGLTGGSTPTLGGKPNGAPDIKSFIADKTEDFTSNFNFEYQGEYQGEEEIVRASAVPEASTMALWAMALPMMAFAALRVRGRAA